MADKHMTLEEFKVNLEDLRNAATEIGLKKKWIMDCMDGVRTCFTAFEGDWHAPSEVTFHDVQLWFDKSYTHLESILDDIIGRMWKAYNNYHHAETANVVNLSMKGKHRDDASPEARREAAVSAPKHDDHQGGDSQLRLKDAMLPRSVPEHDAQALLPIAVEREDGV